MDKVVENLGRMIPATSSLTTEEALEVINHVYHDGRIDPGEADALFELNATLGGTNPAWDARFIEAVKDFILGESEGPRHWVTDAESNWLITNIERDGQICPVSELELLLRILREAEGAPLALGHFTMRIACDRIIDRGKAVAEDIERVRRALYAAGSDGGTWVSRFEAEMMFRTNDAVAYSANDKGWSDLFARAIANHLMARAHPNPVGELQALAREAWLADTDVSVKSTFNNLVGGLSSGWFKSVTHDEAKAQAARAAMNEAAARAAEQIDEPEVNWLLRRIRKDTSVSPAERALVEFLKDEAPGFSEGILAAAAA
ncbi:MAG: hypothetical protein ACRBEQ_05020 [Hyphomonas sp.]